MSRQELRTLELRDRLQFADLSAGRATADTINELRLAATLSVRLAELGFGSADDALAARVALDLVDGGRLQHAEALAAVGRLVDYLAAQRAAAPRGRILQAMGLVGWR